MTVRLRHTLSFASREISYEFAVYCRYATVPMA